MKLTVQSKIVGDTKWNFRYQSKHQMDGIFELYCAIRRDKRLKVHNDYRIVNSKGEVVFSIDPNHNK